MKTKSIFSLLLGLFVLSTVQAQQEAQFTQYNDNMLYYNPAYAGSRGYLEVAGIHRQQWIGIKGAPMSQTVSFHTPIDFSNIGLGLSVLNDRVGPLNQTWLNADISYTLRFRNKTRLSFGMNAGFNMLSARFSDLNLADANDDLLSQDMPNQFLPNLGAGAFYRSKHFYVGFSVPRIVQSKSEFGLVNYDDQRHYYFSAGGYFQISDQLAGRPSIMFKFTDNAPFALDLSYAFVINEKFWIGANYRLSESVGVLAQIQLNDNFKLGYSFDVSTSKLVRYNYGTHEIMLSYRLFKKSRNFETTRCFYF